MRVNIILCTYNRCQSLQRTLESIEATQTPDSFKWQVLIIDNNSKDQTRAVAETFCLRDPAHFRYLFEPQQGKSHALNRGIREAESEVLAFLDDDVTVEPTWLHELTKQLSEPEWAGAGGRVYLPKDFSPPNWMASDGHNSLLSILALFDLGPEPGPLFKPPLGNNMAFRKQVFMKYGGFRTDLGPSPGSEIRYEDTEFGERLLKNGEKILYAPSAIVRHAIPERRLKKEYFLAYYYDYGRALIRVKGHRPPVGLVPRSLISLTDRLLNMMPRKIWWWFRESDPKQKFLNKCAIWATAGEITEIWDQFFAQPQKGPVASSNPEAEAEVTMHSRP